MSAGEITTFLILGLGLIAATTFQTLARLHFPRLTALDKRAVVESIMNVVDDVLLKGIAQKIEVLCEKSGTPLPDRTSIIIDVVVNSGNGKHEELLYFYRDLISNGLMSDSFLYAVEVLAVIQAKGFEDF